MDLVLPKTISTLGQGVHDGWHKGAQLYASLPGRGMANLVLGDARSAVPMKPDSLMLWRSATKPVLAVAIAQLWERGMLDWEDPVSRFVPEFARHGKEAITVRHLLTHTACLQVADRLSQRLPWEEAVGRICQAPLDPGAVPGRQAAYVASVSWLILGEILQRLDGRACAQFIREEIFQPLGMIDSWLGLPPERYRAYGDRIALVYQTDRQPARLLPFWNTEEGCALCRPGGNGRGPMSELGRFYESLLASIQATSPGSGRILQPDTVRLLIGRHRTGLWDQTLGHPVDCGLGFILDSRGHGSGPVPYGYGPHCSAETFGHSGAQSSCAFADPRCGLVVAWACNGLPGERAHQKRAWAINQAIYEDLGLV